MLKILLVFLLSMFSHLPAVAAEKLSFTDEAEASFLSPDQAFGLELTVLKSQKIQADFRVAKGYYLYKNRLQLKTKSGELLALNLPVGEMKEDATFGRQEVYHQAFSGTANIGAASAQGELEIIARYQGCSEKGLCYAPITKTYTLNLAGDAQAKSENGEVDSTTRALKSGNLWWVIGGFFLAGLLLSFTPCVLPMIPILSSIIVGAQNKADSRPQTHAFSLSLAYVLGMALSYTLAGVAAGLTGNLLSQTLQQPWVLALTALLFVALALSMFGLYELKLPAALENKMLNLSKQSRGGHCLGVFAMGAISALIVSPCVAAPLAGALIYIGQTQNVWLGGVALFALALGMGVPLLVIGASAGKLLPKAGAWMTHVRNFFGVLMLLMAAYIVWPILPKSIIQPLNQTLGITSQLHLPFQRVKSVAELDAAIAQAKGKRVMLDFYADWCVACKEMERFTFSEKTVQNALQNTVLLQADVTENNADDQALLKRFGLFGPPAIILFDAEGKAFEKQIIGYQKADEFLTNLQHYQ